MRTGLPIRGQVDPGGVDGLSTVLTVLQDAFAAPLKADVERKLQLLIDGAAVATSRYANTS